MNKILNKSSSYFFRPLAAIATVFFIANINIILGSYTNIKVKGKVTPLQARCGPEGG